MLANKLPNYIQPIRLAERNASLQGVLALANCKRLIPLLLDDQGVITADLQFGRDAEGFYYLLGTLQAHLHIECQRCLQPMTEVLTITVSLSPVKNEKAAERLPERYEPLLVDEDEQVTIITLLEDELLLNLPIVPKHNAENCQQSLKNP